MGSSRTPSARRKSNSSPTTPSRTSRSNSPRPRRGAQPTRPTSAEVPPLPLPAYIYVFTSNLVREPKLSIEDEQIVRNYAAQFDVVAFYKNGSFKGTEYFNIITRKPLKVSTLGSIDTGKGRFKAQLRYPYALKLKAAGEHASTIMAKIQDTALFQHLGKMGIKAVALRKRRDENAKTTSEAVVAFATQEDQKKALKQQLHLGSIKVDNKTTVPMIVAFNVL